MPKTTTPKWVVIATWRRFLLAATKAEAEDALRQWKAKHEAAGWTIHGSLSSGYLATRDVARRSARVLKLVDRPVCYIGVVQSDVDRLRAMEAAGNPDFERYSDLAKAKSAVWSRVETF